MIFVASILIIALIWVMFWGVNKIHIYKADKLEDQITSLTFEIDSTKKKFPKASSFDEILGNSIPSEFFIEKKTEPLETFDLEFLTNKDASDDISTANFRQLYKLLWVSNYPFDAGGLSKFDIPTFHDFKDKHAIEFSKDFADKKELKRCYDFLKLKKFIIVDFEKFAFNLQGLPFPPPHETWIAYENKKKQLEKIQSERNTSKLNVMSTDGLDAAKGIAIIVLTVVYPFRFLVWLLLCIASAKYILFFPVPLPYFAIKKVCKVLRRFGSKCSA